MTYVHQLGGCTPTPLAHYLKALGVLRVIAEQADSSARGWWKDQCFHLATTLSADELMRFFLNEYAPSPITAPWNKGSGFFAANDPGLRPLEQSTAIRYEPLRGGIKEARKLLANLAKADAAVRLVKAETKKKGLTKAQRDSLRADPSYRRRLSEAERIFSQLKRRLIPACRLAWRGAQRAWIDAAIILTDAEPSFPALLGTGGNDGRLDFTSNYYQRLVELFDPKTGAPQVGACDGFASALWGTPNRVLRRDISVGQYLPGAAGGANGSNGPSADPAVNPVDFVLMLEGALLFTASATRRLNRQTRAQAVAPFTVRNGPAGYPSASPADGGQRGEQWMPLWSSPSTMVELAQLLREGRASLHGRDAGEPLEFARAIARLGVARGVNAFQRFGYIERNGQSNLAIPLGTFEVPETPVGTVALLDDLTVWTSRLQREARDEHAPARLRNADRRLSDVIFAVVQHPNEPSRWQALLLALANVEAVMVSGSGFRVGPIPKLSLGWVKAANDGSAEFRLALALALQGAPDGEGRWDSVRRHWLPLDDQRRGFATSGEQTNPRIAERADVVIAGREAASDMTALVARRLTEAAQDGERYLPLQATSDANASLADLAAVLAGSVDLRHTLALGRALSALDRRAWRMSKIKVEPSSCERIPDDAWLAIRLSLLPWRLDDQRDIVADPVVVRRLVAGDIPAAFERARRRLSSRGINCTVDVAIADRARARLWAAALAFPINRKTARTIAGRLDRASTRKGTIP